MVKQMDLFVCMSKSDSTRFQLHNTLLLQMNSVEMPDSNIISYQKQHEIYSTKLYSYIFGPCTCAALIANGRTIPK